MQEVPAFVPLAGGFGAECAGFDLARPLGDAACSAILAGFLRHRLVVSALFAAPDGPVWAGLARGRGVAVWRAGRLVDAAMPNPSREVNDIAGDRDGGVWVARGGREDALVLTLPL